MKAAELIEVLANEGGALRLQDGQLVFDGPAEVLQQHREAIATLRLQLTELLSNPPCTCETVGGWLYLCDQHQATPSGPCLVEPAPDRPHADLVEKAALLFGGRALAGGL
jgi:hypothetical protein